MPDVRAYRRSTLACTYRALLALFALHPICHYYGVDAVTYLTDEQLSVGILMCGVLNGRNKGASDYHLPTSAWPPNAVCCIRRSKGY